MREQFVPFNNRAGGHYLRQWYRLQKNIHTLGEVETIEAKILFSSLAELPEEERIFLAHKYYQPSIVKGTTSGRVSDVAVAELLGMSLQEYRVKRAVLEGKLNHIIHKYKEYYADELEAVKQ